MTTQDTPNFATMITQVLNANQGNRLTVEVIRGIAHSVVEAHQIDTNKLQEQLAQVRRELEAMNKVNEGKEIS